MTTEIIVKRARRFAPPCRRPMTSSFISENGREVKHVSMTLRHLTISKLSKSDEGKYANKRLESYVSEDMRVSIPGRIPVRESDEVSIRCRGAPFLSR